MLRDAGLNGSLCDKLEEMLLAYTGERSSRGILQGVYPSDLFGAFYLNPVDRFFEENGIMSVRYVDDIYVFVRSVAEADEVLRKLIPTLRQYGLRLNEAKSKIIVRNELFTEEPDLEDLFNGALQEMSEQVDEEEDDEGYGFQTPWDANDDEDDEHDEEADHDEDDEVDAELEATKRLFDSIETYSGHEENIERFCLPLFSKANSDYAVNHVMNSFTERPSMTQIYCSYLGKFINDQDDIKDFLVESLSEEGLFDWQKIWIIACLHQSRERDTQAVRAVNGVLHDASAHEALRAIAATYVGRLGDVARRRALFTLYQGVSPYIQYAIYYSSRQWPPAERRTARTSWGTHGDLNRLYTGSLQRD